jgi:hypothetical protein
VLARVVLEFYQANGCNVALDSLVVTGVSGCVNSVCIFCVGISKRSAKWCVVVQLSEKDTRVGK